MAISGIDYTGKHTDQADFLFNQVKPGPHFAELSSGRNQRIKSMGANSIKPKFRTLFLVFSTPSGTKPLKVRRLPPSLLYGSPPSPPRVIVFPTITLFSQGGRPSRHVNKFYLSIRKLQCWEKLQTF